MEAAKEELERRRKFLNGLIQKKKAKEQQEQNDRLNVRVRASDMPLPLQNKAFKCARDQVDFMPGKLDSKRLALALKKEFDSSFGPAWHCIVGALVPMSRIPLEDSCIFQLTMFISSSSRQLLSL